MLRRNLLHALRSLPNRPAFAAVIILTLALGIGANTAIFSVVYAALLRPLPYDHIEQLVLLGEARRQMKSPNFSASYPDYLDWQRSSKTFQFFVGFSGDAFTLDTGGEPQSTAAVQATPNFFTVTGVKLALGRDFIDSDMQADIPRSAILSDALWRTTFGADPNVIGRIIRLDHNPVAIVGVLPRDFGPVNSAPLWVCLHPNQYSLTGRNLRWLSVIGRLRSGVSIQAARAEMESITHQLEQQYPKENNSILIDLAPLRDRIVGPIRPVLLLLLAAVGLVLLITCANVANLLMLRSVSLRKEFAIRAALGAGRGTLLGQVLAQSLILSGAGALFGLLFAQFGIKLLLAAIPELQLQSLPYLRDAGINLPVLAFLCGVALLTAILFGLAPGLSASRADLNDLLKEETRGGTSSGQNRLRNALVVAEIAISLVLLAGAGLLLQSFRAILGQDTGFDLRNTLTFDVNLPDASYPSDKVWPYNTPAALRFEHRFLDRLHAIPGVLDVASTTAIPANGGSGTIRFVVEGRPTTVGQDYECDILTVDSTYYSTLKVPLVSGRFFAATDSFDSPWVVIVNRAFVRNYFPDQSPIGKRVRFTYNAHEPYRQIVGIVGDTAEDDLAAPRPPIIYTLNDQGPNTYLSFLVRTAGQPMAFVGSVRSALREMDPQIPIIQPRTLEQVAEQSPSVFLRSYPSLLVGGFAALALALAAVGLYGLISYAVLQRTREIGIRVAMGAQGGDVLRLILRQGVFTAVLGVIIGVVAGLLLTRLMSSLLFGIAPADWRTFTAVSIFLLLVALAASAIPARRATRVDPIVALRHE